MPSRMTDIKSEMAEKDALVVLDIAIELVAELCPQITLYTRGYFINVSMTGLPDEPWATAGYFTRRSVSTRESSAR